MTTALNWIDYIFIAILLLSILSGFGRGFVKEVVSLVTWIVAFVVAILFSNQLATYFTSTPQVQSAISSASSAIGMSAEQPASYVVIGLSFFILFAGIIIVGSLVGYIINSVIAVSGIGIVNRLFGGVFGLLRGYLIVLVLIFLAQLTSFGDSPAWHRSQIVISSQPAVQWLGNLVSPSLSNLKSKFEQKLQEMGSQLQNVTGQFQ